MTDVFVSYARADRSRVAPLAHALEERGWSVWWDRRIPPGRTFDEVIEEALGEAHAVVCVWTQAGVDSRWVRTEAAEGLARGILVPVALDDVRIPLAFRRIQAADLTDWEPGLEHAGFDELAAAIEAVIEAGPVAEMAPEVVEAVDPAGELIDRAHELAASRDWAAVIALLTRAEKELPGLCSTHPEAKTLLEQAQRTREADEFYEEAEMYYTAGRWRDVVDRLEQMRELDPANPAAERLRERAERHIQREQEALRAREHERAVEALEAREWEIAVTRYERLLESTPDDETVAAELARARAGLEADHRYRVLRECFDDGRWNEVVAGVTEMARTHPDYGDPDGLLGRSWTRLREAARTSGPTAAPPPPASSTWAGLGPTSRAAGAAERASAPVATTADTRGTERTLDRPHRSNRWWVAAIVALVALVGGAVVAATLVGGDDDRPAVDVDDRPDDEVPPDDGLPAAEPTDDVGIVENWFGRPIEQARPALEERGFRVRDISVCSGSVGAGEVRQILNLDETVVYLDRDGPTEAGRSLPPGATILVKVGNGTPC